MQHKCRYCEYWRRPNYSKDMSIDDWKKALTDLKDFIGHYHIEFAGGEPYIKKGFVELMTFCGEQGLKWGVTTNGAAFGNEKVADWTVAARPFNINISIDSHDAKVHDYSRGIEAHLNDIVAGIGNVARAKEKHGADFPIIIKAVVHKLNFRQIPDLVDWIRHHRSDRHQSAAGRATYRRGEGRVLDRAGRTRRPYRGERPADRDEACRRADPQYRTAARSVAKPFPP